MDCALESDTTAKDNGVDGVTPGKLVATAGLGAAMIGRNEFGV
jgi:hypothetical protein